MNPRLVAWPSARRREQGREALRRTRRDLQVERLSRYRPQRTGPRSETSANQRAPLFANNRGAGAPPAQARSPKRPTSVVSARCAPPRHALGGAAFSGTSPADSLAFNATLPLHGTSRPAAGGRCWQQSPSSVGRFEAWYRREDARAKIPCPVPKMKIFRPPGSERLRSVDRPRRPDGQPNCRSGHERRPSPVAVQLGVLPVR